MKKSLSAIIRSAAGLVILVLLDQAAKHWAVRTLSGGNTVEIWKNVIELRYLENHGMAFGLLQNCQLFFLISTAAVMLLVLWLYIFRISGLRHFRPLNIALILVLAGAAGNFIDRLSQKYVVDFIYLRIIDFPIFNVADCYVTVSAVLLIFLLLFYYKDEDLKEII